MYSVKIFMWRFDFLDKKNFAKGFRVRIVEPIAENLSWSEAKKTKKENKGSWITFSHNG